MNGNIAEKPVRADIFVASPSTNGQSSVRSDIMVAVRKDYAASTGLEVGWGLFLQICRA